MIISFVSKDSFYFCKDMNSVTVQKFTLQWPTALWLRSRLKGPALLLPFCGGVFLLDQLPP